MENMNLKQHIITLLNNKQDILIRWDAGGDECLVYIFVDGEMLDSEDEFCTGLRRVAIQQLQLHSAGEPHLEGEGRLYIEEDAVVLKYSSICYEEEWDDEQYKWISINVEQKSSWQILL